MLVIFSLAEITEEILIEKEFIHPPPLQKEKNEEYRQLPPGVINNDTCWLLKRPI